VPLGAREDGRLSLGERASFRGAKADNCDKVPLGAREDGRLSLGERASFRGAKADNCDKVPLGAQNLLVRGQPMCCIGSAEGLISLGRRSSCFNSGGCRCAAVGLFRV
jgi:hypothetical protein